MIQPRGPVSRQWKTALPEPTIRLAGLSGPLTSTAGRPSRTVAGLSYLSGLDVGDILGFFLVPDTVQLRCYDSLRRMTAAAAAVQRPRAAALAVTSADCGSGARSQPDVTQLRTAEEKISAGEI